MCLVHLGKTPCKAHTHLSSHVCAVGGWWGVQSTSVFFGVAEGGLATHMALEHLLVGLPEVLREEGVDDGVHGRVAVGQAVRCDAEEEGGGCQREDPKFDPQVDDMMWQPGDPEDHDHNQDRLCRLGAGSGGREEERKAYQSQQKELSIADTS